MLATVISSDSRKCLYEVPEPPFVPYDLAIPIAIH